MRTNFITGCDFQAAGVRDFTCEISAVFLAARPLGGSPRVVLYFAPPGKLDVRDEDFAGLASVLGADLSRWLGKRVKLKLARTAEEVRAEPSNPSYFPLYQPHEAVHGCITVAAERQP